MGETLRVILSLVLFALVREARCDEHEYRLVRDLMRNYDPRIRPSKNSTEALNVTFSLALAQIIDVDEKNQIITTNCWLNQVWIDYKLQWNPKEYGGINKLRLPYNAIWRPDILLYNNADVAAYQHQISTNMIVSSDGNVTWLCMVIYKSSCAIDVKYFPFDEQKCSLVFASWTYDGYQVNLLINTEEGDTSNYIQNSEWTLLKLRSKRNVLIYSCCPEPYPDITYTIEMRRKPLFYVFNMILPCWIITLVALLGFYMPSESGEKVTMGITTLLSMTVFLMLVAESMPPTSDVLPLIGLYYGITIGIVSLATAMTVLTLNIHHLGQRGKRVPWIVNRICLGFFAKILCLTFDSEEEQESSSSYYPAAVGPSRGSYTPMKAKKSTPSTAKGKKYPSLRKPKTIRLPFTAKDKYYDATDLDNRRAAASSSTSTHAYQISTAPPNGSLGNQMYKKSSPNVGYRLERHCESTSFPPLDSPPESLLTNDCNRTFIRAMNKVCETIDQSHKRREEDERREAMKREWQHVALVIDRVLLIMFIGLTMGITLGIVFRAPHAASFFLGLDADTQSAAATDTKIAVETDGADNLT